MNKILSPGGQKYRNYYLSILEQRLKNYHNLKAAIEGWKLDIGLAEVSEDFEEIDKLCFLIRKNEIEITRIENTLDSIKDDHYAKILKLRYFDRMTDEQVAEKICCDTSTVRRNRKRLLKMLSARFYGIDALTE